MASFSAGTTFQDNVAGDITAAKLEALVNAATPTSGLIQDRTAESAIAADDTLLFGDFSDSNNLKRMTVANFNNVVTTGTGTAASPAIVPTGDSNTGIFFPAADTIAFSEGGAEAMRINSSGQVGIGTTSADSIFHIKDSVAVLTIEGAATSSASVQFKTNTINRYKIATPDSSADLAFYSSGTTERLRIDSSGNVGIGIASPAAKFHVVNGLGIYNSGAGSPAGIDFAGNGNTAQTNSLYVGQVTSGLSAILERGANPLTFHTNSTERVRIDSSGNVLVGTTTAAYGTVSGKFISSSASGSAGLFYNSFSGDLSTSALNIGKFDNNSTTSQIFVKFAINNSGLGCGQINANGSGSAAFGSFSDERLKENITDLEPQLDNILKLRPVEFNYIGSEGGGRQIGFIAQDVKKIYSDAVGEREDGMLTITGWSKTEARLVKAIQELKLENNSLKSRIEALEAA